MDSSLSITKYDNIIIIKEILKSNAGFAYYYKKCYTFFSNKNIKGKNHIWYIQQYRMKLQKLLSNTRRAIDDYQMIQDGDRIGVGISGGKDSLTLLYALVSLSHFYPKKFTVHAITVDLGFDNQNFEAIEALCQELQVPYSIVKTQIASVVFQKRKEKNPCSLCAKMRKGALNDEARKLGIQKIAYAHHMDDVVETMLLSLFYEGRFHTFSPVTHLEQTGLTLIRPLIYVREMDVKGFCNKYNLPVAKSSCPVDGHTKREDMKQLLKQLIQTNPGVRERIFTAIRNGNLEDWE